MKKTKEFARSVFSLLAENFEKTGVVRGGEKRKSFVIFVKKKRASGPAKVEKRAFFGHFSGISGPRAVLRDLRRFQKKMEHEG